MKNITYKILMACALLASAALTACDEVKDNERFIELPPIEASRVVLMEEFTGQLCVNCPAAHEVITGLLKQYPENLISVSIHGGGDAFSFSEDAMPGIGLRNQEGQAYCDEYKVASLPAAVINRTSGVKSADQWAAAIRDEITKPSHIDMKIEAYLSADGKKINVRSEVTPYENMKANLQLWVVESGIVSIQLTPTGYDRNYVHNHVFRGTVNGYTGDAINLVIGDVTTKTHEVDIKDTWNAENLAIVGFVYNDSGIQQAFEAHVNPAPAP